MKPYSGNLPNVPSENETTLICSLHIYTSPLDQKSVVLKYCVHVSKVKLNYLY